MLRLLQACSPALHSLYEQMARLLPADDMIKRSWSDSRGDISIGRGKDEKRSADVQKDSGTTVLLYVSMAAVRSRVRC